MIGDVAALRELTASFIAGWTGIDDAIRVRSFGETEADLGRRIAAFARALGWPVKLEFALRPMDFPRAGPFPKRLHQYTARMRLNGTNAAELSMNANALDIGVFYLLLERLPVLLWLFGSVLERCPGMTADVPCFPGDACFWDAVNFSGSSPGGCLVPDPDYFKTSGYADFRAAMEEAQPAWEARRRAVLWRGSTSGIKRYWPPSEPGDVRWLTRLELCARAQRGSLAELCDAGYTNLVQIPAEEYPTYAPALAPLERPPVPKVHTARYKATFDVDGNSNTWSSGLYCSLLAGACVIKIDSEHGFEQWYYPRLHPWVHYVPVKSDFSDLEEQVIRVLTDDELARTIARAGCELARSMDFMTELRDSVDRLIAWAAVPRAAALR